MRPRRKEFKEEGKELRKRKRNLAWILTKLLLNVVLNAKTPLMPKEEVVANTTSMMEDLRGPKTNTNVATMSATTSTMTLTTATTEEIEAATTIEDQGDTAMIMMMMKTTAATGRPLMATAFQQIGPSRIYNSVMFSAMTRMSRKDTASPKITESSNTVVLVPVPIKEPIQ